MMMNALRSGSRSAYEKCKASLEKRKYAANANFSDREDTSVEAFRIESFRINADFMRGRHPEEID